MQRSFPRDIAALPQVFDFAAEFLEGEAVADRHHFAVNFALEEIFTNLVRHSAGGTGEILVGLDRAGDQIRVWLTGAEAVPFDLTQAPDPPIDVPLQERRVGGLGIFLTRKVMDSVDYAYADGRSTITLTKRLE
jgi:anti-sigma regulatory factor (Ser/Thr protein kinase)